MFLPSKHSFSLVRSVNTEPVIKSSNKMFLPNKHSFLLARSKDTEPTIQSDIQEFSSSKPIESLSSLQSFSSLDYSNKIFLPNKYSFLLARFKDTEPTVQSNIQEFISSEPLESESSLQSSSSSDSSTSTVVDNHKRNFLKIASIAGISVVGSLLLPKKADALILGGTPTSSVVGVKNVANTRINPATEETLDEVLKTSDLTFDTGSLEVKVTSLPPSSFSDSGSVARAGLVDADRHLQVDVLSSALPTTASTETTLQTISFGGFKFTLRLATDGDIDYIGEAAIGTVTSASSWRVKKVDSSTGTVIEWAGTGIFDQVWDNRDSLSYS